MEYNTVLLPGAHFLIVEARNNKLYGRNRIDALLEVGYNLPWLHRV